MKYVNRLRTSYHFRCVPNDRHHTKYIKTNRQPVFSFKDFAICLCCRERYEESAVELDLFNSTSGTHSHLVSETGPHFKVNFNLLLNIFRIEFLIESTEKLPLLTNSE